MTESTFLARVNHTLVTMLEKMFEKLKPLLAIYKHRLPSIIRKRVSSLVTCSLMTPLRTEILARINPLSIFLFTGNEKYSGANFKSLVISSRPMALYLASVIYAGNTQMKEIGQVSLRGTKLKSNFFPEVDMILAVTYRSFSQFLPTDGFIIIPKEVYFTLDLSDPLETIFGKLNRRRRRSIRTIKKLGYSYEVTHDKAKFNLFYYGMYCPHLIKRHHKLATPESFAYLRQLFKNGGLLLVKRNNRYISGILYCLKNETAWTPGMGIFEEHEHDEYARRTAGDALLYFLIRWAKKQGYKKLDYGNSRPFLNDGVVRYKREWQMKVQTRGERVILAKLCNFGKGMRSFLANNPFIFFDRQHLNGCVLVDRQHPVTKGEVEHIFKQYYTHGMSSLVILSTSGFERKSCPKAANKIEKRWIPNSLSHLFKTARKAGQDLKYVEIKERTSG